ncbi:hypothetical protein CspeluHIS016_0300290 [Cutaneotrichosporon spelunceum]|uniref:NEDD8-activating enzyme E1 catalytic subunit n=1 Tax=Cutaneotrichosporon spelunceum TaxID=1672016 RepID=A0AAD3TSW1_9TREE|nr:hypothetical protein CspeluHIS016_0300290 [Cutaneotrichosporon spelunceum]
MTKRVVRVALLICDVPPDVVQKDNGTYFDIFRRWLEDALKTYPDADVATNTQLVVEPYNVVDKLEFPSHDRFRLGTPDAYDVVMLTGSKHTAYDTNSHFGPQLIEWMRDLANAPEFQHVKIIGVCYGHQILSLALGGECQQGTNGWEVGVYGCDMTDDGRYWWSDSVVSNGDSKIYVEQMHKDVVTKVPPGCDLLLRSDKYPVHSFVKKHPASTPEKPLAQILTIQGHPEFTPGIVSSLVEMRAAAGVFNTDVAAEARRRLGGKDGSGGEGEGRLGWAIWRVMLQDLSANVDDYVSDESRYAAINKLLDREGPLTDGFEGAEAAKDFLRRKCKILVIGAGGLGCEILQDLALTGFGNIHVIDMDTIDISNLNRQFLFREADVGKSKAECAAAFINKRVPGVKVTPHHSKIQDHPDSFYMQFNIVIAGLDSVSARRWINAKLVEMVDMENPESLKPLIDGGTEGFKGQSRVILPTISSCYECSLDIHTPPTAFPICTIANTPRLPEHCIEWASVLEWPRLRKNVKLDTDDPDHIQWLYDKASTRAAAFNIEGVTWTLTQGVVKNIIPAIASTNAIIAASCCNEAFKIATSCAPMLNNYMLYNGNDSLYTFTWEYEKRPDCPVCGGESMEVEVKRDWTLEQLMEWLSVQQKLLVKRPGFMYSTGDPLFMWGPPQIHEQTKPNLQKLVSDLVLEGDEIIVTDPNLPFHLTVKVTYA